MKKQTGTPACLRVDRDDVYEMALGRDRISEGGRYDQA